MKVYIDDNEDYRITYSSRDESECLESMGMQPIIVESLKNHDKQVRKEVIDKVYAVLEQAVPHDLCWSWAVIKKELNEIQGETK